jgi:hypothetical protein
MLIERKFLSIYKGYFFSIIFQSYLFSKEVLFERMLKNSAFQKNGIQKKKLNFKRTLFDQSTSSHLKLVILITYTK